MGGFEGSRKGKEPFLGRNPYFGTCLWNVTAPRQASANFEWGFPPVHSSEATWASLCGCRVLNTPFCPGFAFWHPLLLCLYALGGSNSVLDPDGIDFAWFQWCVVPLVTKRHSWVATAPPGSKSADDSLSSFGFSLEFPGSHLGLDQWQEVFYLASLLRK